MRRVLQLQSRKCSLDIVSRDSSSFLAASWILPTRYLVHNITLILNPNHSNCFEINQLKIQGNCNPFPTPQLTLLDSKIQPHPQNQSLLLQRLTLEKSSYLLDALLVRIKLKDAEGAHKQGSVQSDDVKQLGLEGVELEYYNMDIYQSLNDRSNLFALYSQLLANNQQDQASLVFFQLGLVAKNSGRQIEAEEIFTVLYRLQKSRELLGDEMLLLNLIDTCTNDSGRLRFLNKLCGEEDTDFDERSLFRDNTRYLSCLISKFSPDNFIQSTTIFNIFSFFIVKVGCSAAESYSSILGCLLQIFNSKSFLKSIKRESAPNYQMLISSVEQIIDGLRQCVSYLSGGYAQRFCQYVITCLGRPLVQGVHQAVVKLAHALVKECQGGVEIKYQEWFRLVYLLEGEEMMKGEETEHDMYYNKDLKGVAKLYQDFKRNILITTDPQSRTSFLDSLNKHFIQMVYHCNINLLLLSHFLEVISLFCVSASEHLLFDYSKSLAQFYNPHKALIGKLVELCVEPEAEFRKVWESFMLLYSLVQPHISDSLNDVVVTLLNRFMKEGIRPQQISHFSVLVGSLESDTKYPQFWKKFFHLVVLALPNSLQSEVNYQLLGQVVQLCPTVLDGQCRGLLVRTLLDPYTEYKEGWVSLLGQVRESVISKPEELKEVLEMVLSKPKPLRKSKVQSGSESKYLFEVETRKVYFLEKLLWPLPILPAQIIQILCSSCNTLCCTMTQNSQQLRNILYYKYYFLRRTLTFNSAPIPVQNLTIIETAYPPVTNSFLITVAAARHLIPLDHHLSFCNALRPLVHQPWKNIQSICLNLLVFFSQPLTEQAVELVEYLAASKDVIKITTSLVLIYKAVTTLDPEPLASFVEAIDSTLTQLSQPNPLKQLQIVSKYLLGLIQERTDRSWGERLVPSDQDEKQILMSFDYETRLDDTVKKNMDKPIEYLIKLDDSFGVPKKVYREQQIVEEEEMEVEVLGQVVVPVVEEKILRKYVMKKQATTNEERPTKGELIAIKPIVKEQINCLFDSQESPRARSEYQEMVQDSGTKSQKTPKATTRRKLKTHDSPVIQIESKNSKFKISLAQLNQAWRQNMELISKKPKTNPSKRKKPSKQL